MVGWGLPAAADRWDCCCFTSVAPARRCAPGLTGAAAASRCGSSTAMHQAAAPPWPSQLGGTTPSHDAWCARSKRHPVLRRLHSLAQRAVVAAACAGCRRSRVRAGGSRRRGSDRRRAGRQRIAERPVCGWRAGRSPATSALSGSSQASACRVPRPLGSSQCASATGFAWFVERCLNLCSPASCGRHDRLISDTWKLQARQGGRPGAPGACSVIIDQPVVWRQLGQPSRRSACNAHGHLAAGGGGGPRRAGGAPRVRVAAASPAWG